MKNIVTILLIALSVSAFAQNQIKGVVSMKGDNSPIIGATVYIEEIGIGTVTDRNGLYELNDINAGTYHISISSVGFNTIDQEITMGASPMEYNFALTEKAFDLPQVVVESVSMTGGLAGIQNTLGSAHYIGQKEIQKFSYTDINRTLRNIPGVNIQEEDGYGLRPNIGLRASGSERSSKITVMEDGVLIAPAPYAAPAAYYFPTIGRMEAIEIMKGSSQIKYGPYTTGGAINLISTPVPSDFSGHADFIAGSDGYKMLHANMGNSHKNFGYMVETLQYSADGFKELDNGGNTGFNKEDYLAKFKVNTNPNAPIYQSLTFKIGQARESSNETYLGLTDEDFEINPVRRYAASAEDLMTTEQTQLSLTHFAQLTDFLDLHTTVYKNDFSRNWYKLDKVDGQSISNILNTPSEYAAELAIVRGESDADDALAVKANNRAYTSEGVQTNAIFHFRDGDLSHKIDVGLRVHRDELDRFQWVDSYNIQNGIMQLASSGVPGTESNRIESANALSTYIQYKLAWDKLTLTPGLRYEHISLSRTDYGKADPERVGTSLSTRENTVDVLIPGLAASYKLSESANLFGGIHKGFAPPGSTEGANPEESWNYELGYRFANNGIRLQALSYYNDYANLLGSDLAATGGTGSQDVFNGGEAVAMGIEMEASYDLLNNTNSTITLPLSVGYTYTNTTFDNDFESSFGAWGTVTSGDFLPYVPQHQLSMSLSAEHAKVLVDLSARYSTEMLTTAGTFDDENVGRTDEAFTMDFAVNYRLTKEISAFVNVNNLTNNVYIVSRRPAGVRPNQPRTYNLGLKANF